MNCSPSLHPPHPPPSFADPRRSYYDSPHPHQRPPPPAYCPAPVPDHYQMEVEVAVQSSSSSAIIACDPPTLEELMSADPNSEQLDEFCRYIDSSGDDDVYLPSPPPSAPAVAAAGPLLSPSPNRRRCFSLAASQYHHQHPQQHQYAYGEHCGFAYAPLSYSYGGLHGQASRKRRRNCNAAFYAAEGESSPESSPVKTAFPFDFEEQSERVYPWKIELESAELWRAFDRVGTEMVITKNGRYASVSL